jgi:outer membrane protein assembly factor BamE
MNRYLLALVPVLAACGSFPDINVDALVNPWKIDVRQGNFVSQKMVAQLKPGQTREQVRFILGSPLVADPFHADRWDYVYRFASGGGEVLDRRLTVFFQDNKLTRVAGDVVSSASTATTENTGPATRVIDIVNPDAPVPTSASGDKK